MITSKVMSALAVGAFLCTTIPASAKTETLFSASPASGAVCRASSPQSGIVWGYPPYKIAPATDSETGSVWGYQPDESNNRGFC
jgi:hypothetical protein